MKRIASLVAAAFVAGALAGSPAEAAGFAIGVGPNGINFSVSSGGYCDSIGCPDAFWDMPVYYCPVYYKGDWYRGPVYYRRAPGGMQFWIRGKWRYDAWRGPRPGWACTDRMGPALGFEYYERNGFRMRDEWRTRWRRDHGYRPMPPAPHNDWRGPDRHDRHDGDRWDDRRGADRNNNHGPDKHSQDSRGPDNRRPDNHGSNNHGPDTRGPDNHGPDNHGYDRDKDRDSHR